MRTVHRQDDGRRAALFALAGALGLGLSACSPAEARAPNPTHPIDERRAVEVIRRALRSEGVEPGPGRDEKIMASGKTLHVDVGVLGKRWGVAFVSAEDAQAIGDALPAANKKDEKLKLVPAGEDGKAHVLLLFQQNYLYDDLAGDAHEQTMITAEGSLGRDVRDFAGYAKSKGFE
jgi:hypothetical protein